MLRSCHIVVVRHQLPAGFRGEKEEQKGSDRGLFWFCAPCKHPFPAAHVFVSVSWRLAAAGWQQPLHLPCMQPNGVL